MLKQLRAFEDAGSWRLLSPSYQAQVFADMLIAVVENEWQVLAPPGIRIDQFIQAVDAPRLVIRQCCLIYGSIMGDSESRKNCTLDAAKIAVFCAKQLFEDRTAEAQMKQLPASSEDGWLLDSFMDKWQLRVPDQVAISADLLRGVAIVKVLKNKPMRLVYFPEEDLPLDPKQRFERLFQVQEKWTVKQLEPYVQYVSKYFGASNCSLIHLFLGLRCRPLVAPGVTQAALLLKFTRSSRQGDSPERLYSRR